MTRRKSFDIKSSNTIGSLLFMVLVLVGLYFLARGIFWILSVVAPLLIIAAAIIDYKVIVNYVKWLVRLTKKNAIVGIGAIILSVIGYPVVFAYLLGRAIFNKRMEKLQKEANGPQKGEYVDFEEIEVEEEKLDLPPLPKAEKKSDYDEMFN